MTITQYIASVPDERKADIEALHALIKTLCPSLKPYLHESPSMTAIGYGKYAYKTKSGCTGDWFTVGLSNQKNYLSLYIMATRDGGYLAEEYKKKLPKASIGRSCIRFKKLTDVDETVITELLNTVEKLGPPTS